MFLLCSHAAGRAWSSGLPGSCGRPRQCRRPGLHVQEESKRSVCIFGRRRAQPPGDDAEGSARAGPGPAEERPPAGAGRDRRGQPQQTSASVRMQGQSRRVFYPIRELLKCPECLVCVSSPTGVRSEAGQQPHAGAGLLCAEINQNTYSEAQLPH